MTGNDMLQWLVLDFGISGHSGHEDDLGHPDGYFSLVAGRKGKVF